MKGAVVEGIITKFSADKGLGVIKHNLSSARVIRRVGDTVTTLEPTDAIFFSVDDIVALDGNRRVRLSTAVNSKSEWVPVVLLGEVVFFTLQREKFNRSDTPLSFGPEIWAQQIRVRSSLCSDTSHRCMSRSKWLKYRGEQERLQKYLYQGIQDRLHVIDDSFPDPFSGVPVDF
ncbi:uncharacterized protein TEOVI_000302100 [Trypanosoma equiperdum]|uniref:Uncharacterized protein n=1 Tax=Trypanosoma equiperdum TaxID=5694 RepID=A0A1G4IGD4_TRYEQ|nr:hypothetical protein, conserved [Trypanosoma equiperdum]